jgi:predicted nucleic acid-binding protein
MVVPVAFASAICSDRDDDKFLEAAVAAKADYVVTGDVTLLSIKSFLRIEIVKPAQFLKLLPR